MTSMHQYQKDALQFMLDNPKSYLALDMGLGKTLTTIRWIQAILPEVQNVLVIAPLRTIYSSWPEELEKWAPELTYSVLHGAGKVDALSENVNIYLINFEGIQWLFDQLKRRFKLTGGVPFRGLVIDEGSMVKSATTKRFKILKKMCNIFPKYRTILSGTPAPNSLLDLWSQYYLLDNGERLGKFITGYKRDYFYQVDRMGFVWSIRKGSKEVIYKAIEDITYRLDAADHIDIPERIDNIIKVKLPKKSMDLYTKLESEFFLKLEEDIEIEAFNAPALAMKMRQFVQGAMYTGVRIQGNTYQESDGTITEGARNFEVMHNEKLKVLDNLLEEANGQGILCAIQFKFELEMIRNKYPNVPVIAGGTKPSEAAQYIKQWNAGEIPLLLCHPASLSHGVNLQTGSHIIVWYGLTWSLEQYLQFNARLHRQGQKKGVVVHHLVCEDTIDERVMTALKSKFKGQKQLLDYLKDVNRGR